MGDNHTHATSSRVIYRSGHRYHRVRMYWWSTLLGAVLGAAAFMLAFQSLRPRSQAEGSPKVGLPIQYEEDDFPTEAEVNVKTIRPRRDPNFVRSIREPAYVEEFLRADLYSNVAGVVKYIEKNIGDPVTKGEVLVELDVPDRIQEVAQKEALVKQARAELLAARAEILTLEEGVETARSMVDEKKALVEKANEASNLSRLELARIQELAKRNSVQPQLVDEKQAAYKTAQAHCKSAEAAVKRALSDHRVARARVVAAEADLEVRQAKILVAEEEKRRVQAQADFAKIRSPFNGQIVARNVDPGAFVQNATTGRTLPCLSLRRVDMVTVYMMVPERSVPFVTNATEAIIQLDSLPSQQIQTRVTRYSGIYDPEKGRAMRIEVDLYNPPEPSYKRSMLHGVAAFLAPLGGCDSMTEGVLTAAGQSVWGRRGRLQPGMYGTMRLLLQKFENVYLVPCSAYFTQGGRTYILQVVDGRAKKLPVRVQYEDGVRAKIAIIEQEANPDQGIEERLTDLTGDEQIIMNQQGEIDDGQEVKTTPEF